MGLYDAADERETEPCAFGLFDDRVVTTDTDKLFEEAGLVIGGDADTGVLHLDADHAFVRADSGGDSPAFGCIFDGVGDVVDECFADKPGDAVDGGHVVGCFNSERVPPAVGEVLLLLCNLREELVELDFSFMLGDVGRFELAEHAEVLEELFEPDEVLEGAVELVDLLWFEGATDAHSQVADEHGDDTDGGVEVVERDKKELAAHGAELFELPVFLSVCKFGPPEHLGEACREERGQDEQCSIHREHDDDIAGIEVVAVLPEAFGVWRGEDVGVFDDHQPCEEGNSEERRECGGPSGEEERGDDKVEEIEGEEGAADAAEEPDGDGEGDVVDEDGGEEERSEEALVCLGVVVLSVRLGEREEDGVVEGDGDCEPHEREDIETFDADDILGEEGADDEHEAEEVAGACVEDDAASEVAVVGQEDERDLLVLGCW